MAPTNLFIRYNTDTDFWEYDSSVAHDGSGPWVTLPVDGSNIVFGTGSIAWAKVSKSGSSLADLATRSAGDLNSGTLLDARLSSNVPLKNATVAITGAWSFDSTSLVLDITNHRVGFGLSSPGTTISIQNGATTSDQGSVIASNAIQLHFPSYANGRSYPGITWTSNSTTGPNLGIWGQMTNSGSSLFLGVSSANSGVDITALTLNTSGGIFAGSIKTANPNSGTALPWKLGSLISASVTLVTSQYIEVDINGTLYKLATVS